MDGKVKMQRITAANRVQFQRFAEILHPEVLHTAIPRLATAAEGRKEFKGALDEMSSLGSYCHAGGFDPTRTFQHVANIDVSVWSAILEAFGKFDEESGELIHDGLLYKADEHGTVKLNKDFLYALIGFLEANGYECDLRGKIKLN
jgi:hypothetical protein